MIASHAVLIAVVALGWPASGDPPLAWSPSGDWIAYTVAVPSVERSLSGFPLFPGSTVEAGEPDDPGEATGRAITYQVWAVRVEDGQVIKVAEGPGPITSPAWGPDGRGLAFARVAEDPEGGMPAWEVVVAYGAERDVISRRPMARRAGRGESLITEPVAWEPGEGLLAVPDPDVLAMELIDVDRREVVRRIEGARLPSFSPMGGDLAFYRPDGDRWELVEARTTGGPELDRTIDRVERAVQPPAWTADGRGVLYLKERLTGEGLQASLYLHRVAEAEPRLIKEVESPALPGEEILGSYLSVAPDGIDQYYAVQFSKRSATVAFHRGSHPIDRLHPLSGLGNLGAPCLSPEGDRLAVRFGGPGATSVVGLIDSRTQVLSPMTPDLESTAAWISALGRALSLPDSSRERPTRLPFPGELEAAGQFSPNSTRLAKLGSRLTARLEEGGLDGSITAPPALVFSYLSGDFEAAERALGMLSTGPLSPDRSLRLLGLRAQICLARGEDDQAAGIIEFIRDQHREGVARVESDGVGGFSVSQDLDDSATWPEALWRRSQGQDASEPEERKGDSPDFPRPRPVPRARPITPDSISPTSQPDTEPRPGGG